MKKFIKKPVTVETMVFNPDVREDVQALADWMGQVVEVDRDQKMIISTLEGDMVAKKGDVIIRGVEGELYPCDPDIFEKTYEVEGNTVGMNGDISILYENTLPDHYIMDDFIEKLSDIQNVAILDFSEALDELKDGERVARKGWNGKDMFIFLVKGSSFVVNRPPLDEFFPEGTRVDYLSHIDMKTADGSIVPWLASQSDMLAEDWCIVM